MIVLALDKNFSTSTQATASLEIPGVLSFFSLSLS